MILSRSLAPCSSIVARSRIAGPEPLGEGGDGGETELHDEHSLDKLACGRHKIVDGLLLGVLYERELLAHFHTSLAINYVHLLRRGTCASAPISSSVRFLIAYVSTIRDTTFTPTVASRKATQ